jgi:hypothetical protein
MVNEENLETKSYISFKKLIVFQTVALVVVVMSFKGENNTHRNMLTFGFGKQKNKGG